MRFFWKFIFLFLIIIFIFLGYIKIFEIDKFIARKLYPKTYSEYVEMASEKYNVDENLIFAIIKNESNFKNTVSSNKGAQGLMQLMETTALEVAQSMEIYDISNIDLSDPKTNIEIGTKYYSYLYQKYKNTELALAAYNAGSGNVDKWIQAGSLKSDGSDIENIPYKETNMYVRKVIQTKKIYDYVYKE